MAVVENMSFFEVDGTAHFPFGKGSGDRIVRDFGLPNLVRFPIVPDLSAAGDGESYFSSCLACWVAAADAESCNESHDAAADASILQLGGYRSSSYGEY